MVPAERLPEPFNELFFWVYYNQALIAGLLALYVGWLTVKSIRSQIDDEKTAREDKRKRELLSLKAGATLSISEIYEYAGNCIKYLDSFLLSNGALNGDLAFDVVFDKEQKSKQLALPAFPIEALRVLQELILHSDPDDGKALHEILAFSQVHRSSIVEVVDALLGKSDEGLLVSTANVYSEIRDCLGLRQHMVRLFGWARTTEDRILPLCSADEAGDALMWSHLGRTEMIEYVRANWPPRSPASTKLSQR
jgi:hypothetical protein